MNYDPVLAQESSSYYLVFFGSLLALFLFWKMLGWLRDFWNRAVQAYVGEKIRIRIKDHSITTPSAEDALLTVDQIRAQLDQFAPERYSPEMTAKRARLELLLAEVEKRVGDKMAHDAAARPPRPPAPPAPPPIKNDG